MNRQNVTKWCHEFSEGTTDVHDEQRSERPSLISDGLRLAADFYDSGIKELVPRVINVWAMPATMLKNKVIYRQFFQSAPFVN